MSASDAALDQLIEQAATIGQVAAGGDRQVLAARGADPRLLAVTARQAKSKHLKWSEAEEQYVRDQWGHLTIQQIADHLGRSWNAVKVHTTRDMRLPFGGPSKSPWIFTANMLSHGLAVDVHQVCDWLARDLLPYTEMPCRGNRVMRLVARPDVLRFAVNPRSWIYFNPQLVNRSQQKAHLARSVVKFDWDWWERLRALVLRRFALWPDAWWTPGQAAAYYGIDQANINNLIQRGRLPAVRWGNWHVLRSDVVAIQRPVTYHGSGGANQDHIYRSVGEDAFTILALAAGLSKVSLGHMLGRDPKSLDYRLKVLQARGRLAWLVTHQHLPVRFNRRGEMLADWKLLRRRIPRLARVMRALRRQEALGRDDLLIVRAVLQAWARFFARNKAQRALVTNLTSLCRRQTRHFYRILRRLQASGIDPFCKLEV